jgi:hypothetical protein
MYGGEKRLPGGTKFLDHDIFSPKGVYLRQIAVPVRIHQVRNGKMYAIVETEGGFKTLKFYKFQH